jgi:hypothetical protein
MPLELKPDIACGIDKKNVEEVDTKFIPGWKDGNLFLKTHSLKHY